MRGVVGSERPEAFGNVKDATGVIDAGSNRLEIVGNAEAFDRTNQNVAAPASELFTAGN
jgi:hypothetical protein